MNKSFNRTDTSIVVNGGRIKLRINTEQRCRRVVSAMRALKRDILFTWEIIQKMQKLDPTHTYSKQDITYAIGKCVEAGSVLRHPFGGIYTYSLATK